MRRAGLPLAVVALAIGAGARGAPMSSSEPLFPPLPAGETPHARLVRHLNELGFARLRAREGELARVTTREGLEARKGRVRETLLRLLGGLPEARTPLLARVVARHRRESFSVENVVFESLPGFPVTANLYLPDGAGPFPAILASMGHGEGKSADRHVPDLARKGFVVLSYDPLGQGERLQHYDPALRGSRAGGPTDEHGQAAARAELIGESVARYFVWDAVRGLDYLASRPEVDAARLGASGCSGGGTVTTYLAALDERVRAAAVACYVTSWSALLAGPGPQEAEQTLAGFLDEGLDMGDYLALIAPRPLLIASTRDDFFPLDGARFVYEEARRHYGLHGAAERLAWSVAPGGHGTPAESREAINGFFLRWLGDASRDPRDEPAVRLEAGELACTATGQVATSVPSRTVAELIAERARRLPRPAVPVTAGELDAHRSRLREAAARLAGIGLPRAAPVPKVHRRLARPGYSLEAISLPSRAGVELWALLALPGTPGRKPAVLLADPSLRAGGGEPGSDLDARAREGRVVLALEPAGALLPEELPARPSLLGPYAGLHRRAAAVGRSLVGLRAEDLLLGLELLAGRDDVDPDRIAGVARGGLAVPLLHAAAIDERLGRVLLEGAPAGYRAVLEHPIHRDLPELLVPGALREYDLDDLLLALAPRPVTLVDATDPEGRPWPDRELRRRLGPVLEASRALGGGHLRLASRRPGEPLPWP